MDYLIRNATARDVAAIVRLEGESLTAAHWSGQQYEDLFADDSSLPARLVLVAAQDENAMLLGFLVARHVLQDWELENIVVAEKKRGRGIGTSLLTELVARAQMGDGATIFLEVRESNTAARGLYAKLGFKQTGCRKSYYSKPLEDAVLYSKTLRRDRR